MECVVTTATGRMPLVVGRAGDRFVSLEFNIVVLLIVAIILVKVHFLRCLIGMISWGWLFYSILSRGQILHQTSWLQDVCAAMTADEGTVYSFLVFCLVGWVASVVFDVKLCKCLYAVSKASSSPHSPRKKSRRAQVVIYILTANACLVMLYCSNAEYSVFKHLTSDPWISVYFGISALGKLLRLFLQEKQLSVNTWRFVPETDYKRRISIAHIGVMNLMTLVHTLMMVLAFLSGEPWDANNLPTLAPLLLDMVYHSVLLKWSWDNAHCISFLHSVWNSITHFPERIYGSLLLLHLKDKLGFLVYRVTTSISTAIYTTIGLAIEFFYRHIQHVPALQEADDAEINYDEFNTENESIMLDTHQTPTVPEQLMLPTAHPCPDAHQTTTVPEQLISPTAHPCPDVHQTTTVPEQLMLPTAHPCPDAHQTTTVPEQLMSPTAHPCPDAHQTTTVPEQLMSPTAHPCPDAHQTTTVPEQLMSPTAHPCPDAHQTTTVPEQLMSPTAHPCPDVHQTTTVPEQLMSPTAHPCPDAHQTTTVPEQLMSPIARPRPDIHQTIAVQTLPTIHLYPRVEFEEATTETEIPYSERNEHVLMPAYTTGLFKSLLPLPFPPLDYPPTVADDIEPLSPFKKPCQVVDSTKDVHVVVMPISVLSCRNDKSELVC